MRIQHARVRLAISTDMSLLVDHSGDEAGILYKDCMPILLYKTIKRKN